MSLALIPASTAGHEETQVSCLLTRFTQTGKPGRFGSRHAVSGRVQYRVALLQIATGRQCSVSQPNSGLWLSQQAFYAGLYLFFSMLPFLHAQAGLDERGEKESKGMR